MSNTVFEFDMFGKHYIAGGTVVPPLRTLTKRINEIIPDLTSGKPGQVNRILLYDSLVKEFMRRVREGIVAGLIVEEYIYTAAAVRKAA